MCSMIPSPSISIVSIDVGIDQGSNPIIDGVEIFVELICLSEMLPSMVVELPSETPDIGVISSKCPSLS